MYLICSCGLVCKKEGKINEKNFFSVLLHVRKAAKLLKINSPNLTLLASSHVAVLELKLFCIVVTECYD